MNAALKVFTNRAILLAVAAAVLSVLPVTAQTEYDKVVDGSFWNGGRNISGVPGGKPVRVSYAEVSGGFTSGDFKPSWESSSVWNAGAEAKTRVDLEKFTMTGSFSFTQKQGKDMCGSMFIRPGFYPFDIIESTPGDKTLQTYSFSGGVAMPLDERWTVGGRMDFESDNYSKRKDIRHTNYRLDLTVTPSLTFRTGGWTFGAAGIFNKNSESVQAEQVGTATADSYYAFLDKGMMYGVRQVWNGSGIHLSETGLDRFAVKEYAGGAALQTERTLTGGAVYAEIEWLASKGEAGEKSYLFFSFPGRKFTARAGYRHEWTGGTGLFRLRYAWTRQWNNEHIYDKISSGGVTTPAVYGYNKIFERRQAEVVPEFTFYGDGHLAWLYRFRAEAGLTVSTAQSRAVYPYSYNGSDKVVRASASALFNVGRFRLGCNIGFLKGFLEETSAQEEVTDGSSAPYRPESWYGLWSEWENAARIGGGLSVRYGFSLGKADNLYLEAAGSVLHGSGIRYCGSSVRAGGTFKIGYEF